MRAMTLVGQNERGETKFERPLVIGKRDVLIIQCPDTKDISDEELDMIDQAINRSDPERTSIICVPEYIKFRVLRINN